MRRFPAATTGSGRPAGVETGRDGRRDVEFGADAVWLADGADRTVTRIDPVNRQTKAFDVPGDALYVTVDVDSGNLRVLSVPEA